MLSCGSTDNGGVGGGGGGDMMSCEQAAVELPSGGGGSSHPEVHSTPTRGSLQQEARKSGHKG